MKAVLYARTSPKRVINGSKSRREHGVEDSIRPQLDLCRRYCELYEYEIVGEFQDRLCSGKDVKGRPRFRRALRLAVRERAILVVYSQSRFARNTEQACRLIRYLLKRKAGLASVREHIDTSSAFGRMSFRFKAVLDEFEREQTAERTSDAMLEYQRSGVRMSYQPAYGWKIDPNDPSRCIEAPEEIAAIERIRNLIQLPEYRRANGEPSLSKIARKLTAEGFKPRAKGKTWHHSAIRRMLDRK